MRLTLEYLEPRVLLAAPIKPFDLDLLAGSDSGASNSDNITNINNGTIELIAETDSTVAVYNAGYLGDATGQNDTLFNESGGSVTIEAEKGTVAGAMVIDNSQGGFLGTGYIEETAATWDHPENGGTATYWFYITTAGTYYVHGRCYFTDAGVGNSFFVNIDDNWELGETGPALWSNTEDTWHFTTATPIVNGGGTQSWVLTAGWHWLEVHGREPSLLDRFVISTDPNNPTGAIPGPAESITYETYQYTFGAGELIGSAYGTDNSITATAENIDGTSAASDPLVITYDSTTISPGATDLESASDTGDSNIDNITNDTTSTFNGPAGSVEPNATVWLRADGADKRSTTANADGSYSVTLQAGDLAEGANAVDIYYIDLAGNTSTDSADLTVTLDTNAAAPTAAPDLDAGSDTGLSNSDNYTNDTTPTFTGGAGAVENNVTVWLRVGSVNKQSTTAAGDGSFSITLQQGILAEGDNDIDIIYIDTAGNTSGDSPDLTVTLDTVSDQPSAPDLTSDVANDTGSSQIDNITNNDNCQISGTAVANGTVHIRVNGTEVNTTASDGAGDWSYSFLNGDLAEGANTINVTIEDSLGNPESVNSNSLVITLDTTLIPPGAPDLRSASDSGSSNTDNITSDDAAWFDGYAEPGATVQLFVGAAGKGTDTADATTGAWSIQLSNGDLALGTNDITVTVTDAAGNSNTSPALVVTYDASGAAPAAPLLSSSSDSGSSNSDGITNIAAATVYGSVTAGNAVEGGATVHVRTNKNAAGWVEVGTTVADGGGNWSYTFDGADDLDEGTNLVDIYITDLAGNDSTDSADLTIILDTNIADPVLPDLTAGSDTGFSDSDNITAETRPTIQGTAGAVEGLSTVHVWLDTPSGPDTEVGTTTAAGDGSWSYTFTSAAPLEEGVNSIHIVAVDRAGNTSADSPDLSVTINFDTGAEAPPDLEVSSDTGAANDDNITADDTATISGECPAGAVIKIRTNESDIVTFTDNDGTDGDGAAGQWSYTYPPGGLSEGANTIDFLTIDTSNNTSDWSLDLVITLDTSIEQPTQPNLITADDSGASTGDDITKVTNPTITGTAEANSEVSVDINAGTHTDTAVVGANGTWSYNITNGWLNEGANTIFVAATDTAGNVSVNSANLIITLDTTINIPSAPDLTAATDTGVSNSDNITSHANPRIVGTADPNTTITVRLDPDGAATVLGSTTADGAGNWSYTFAGGALLEGDNIVDVLSTDIAGNSIDSANLTITIETAISVPVDLDLTDASDLGDLNNDDLTSLATATITGSADANCTIYVRVNGTEVGSTTSDGAGDWSYTFDGTDDLIEGTNIIDAYAEDDVGNVSGYSADLIVVLDTQVVVPAAPDLDSASDSGTSDLDNYTNDTNATITGACEAGATVLIHLNGNDSFDTVTDSDVDGFWSYTFAGGLNGSVTGTDNIIKVAQRDRAGNLSAFGSILTVTLDNAAADPSQPDLAAASDTGDANDDDLTNQANAVISGTVEANSSLQLFIDQGGGPNLIDTISESLISSGNWTYTLSTGQLAEGNNQITVIATDKAGNISAASLSLTITYDTTIAQPAAPDLVAGSDTGDFDDDNVTSDITPTFVGTADPNCHVTIRVDGESINTVDSDGAGNWSYTFAQGEIQTGVHQIDVVAQDIASNVSYPSDNLTLWLNVEPTQPAGPNLQADSDSGMINTDNLTNITTPVIDGKSDPDNKVYVYVDDIEVGTSNADANGFWNYTFTSGILSEGANIVTIITEDSSGLRSTVSYPLNLVLDTTNPTAQMPDLQPGSDTGYSDTDNHTSDETATIEGLTEAGAWVDLYLNTIYVTRLTATQTGFWSYTFAPGALAEGENEVYIVVTDLAGNVSEPSAALEIILDQEQFSLGVPDLHPDSDTGISDTDNLTSDTTAVIFGIVKPDSHVEILVAGIVVDAVTADGEGNWQYTFLEGQLKEGQNSIEIISTDPVGNSTRSAILEITLDTAAPELYNHFPAGTYEHTTGFIELYLDDSDLDTLAVLDLAGFTLQGSGGDGSYTEGNEWVIPISSVTVDALAGLVQLNTAINLSDDSYQLSVDPAISLRDQAGNAVWTELSVVPVSPGEPFVLSFAIDTQGPPAPTAPQLDPDSDSGYDNNDNITNLDNPLIRLEADPEVTVEIICNGRSAGFAHEYEPGHYQLVLDSSLIRSGENLLLARAFDGLGNSSELSELQSFVYDNQPPQVAALVVEPLWLNFGPTQVSVVFSQNDVDPSTVTDPANYLLIAAGGDGDFDNGNEIIIPVTNVTHEVSTQTVILTMPQTATNTSALTPDHYRLTVPADSMIADAAGNVIEQSAMQEFAVVPAETLHDNERYRFTTSTGNTVTVVLDGRGDALILRGESVGTDNTIEKIILHNTNENTRLLVISRNKTLPLSIGEILADSPLHSIKARRAVITSQINLDDSLARLCVGDIQSNVNLTLISNLLEVDEQTDSEGLCIYADTIGQNVQIDVTGQVQTFKARSYGGGALNAGAAETIIITEGDFAADVTINNGDLNRLKVTNGNLSGNINVSSNIGRLRVLKGDLDADIKATQIDDLQIRQISNSVIRAQDNIISMRTQSGQSVSISAGNNLSRFRCMGDLTDSTISAGGDLSRINISGDAIDNLFMAGADLGEDAGLDGVNDSFSSGDIAELIVKGNYYGSTAAAAVNPGADLTYFTDDDNVASEGNIERVKFGPGSLAQTEASAPFGLLAAGAISPLRIKGDLFEAPFTLNQFRISIVS